MTGAEQKIDKILEEALSQAARGLGKAGLIAGIGGLAGAGLDVYFNGGRNLKEFAKPLAAWGLGGAAAGLLNKATDTDRNDLKKEIKEELKKENPTYSS